MKWFKYSNKLIQKFKITSFCASPTWVTIIALFVAMVVQAEGIDTLSSNVHHSSQINYDSLFYTKTSKSKESKPQKGSPDYYRHKMESYQRFWRGLIPNQARLQYAGSVGMFNIGLGWHYGGPRHHRWESDFMFGFLPKHRSDHNHLTFTLRQSYVPYRIPLFWKFSLEPLATGAMINFISGEEFWVREPKKYPQRYYGFPTALRAHIFLGQRLRWEIPQNKRKYVKAVSLCYDVSTCDLYLVSYATNKFIPLRDILSLSLSVKVDAF